MEAGSTIFDVSYIFYSHLHPDHTGELATILFSLEYSGIVERNKKLIIVAARGFTEFYNKLSLSYGRWIKPSSFTLKIIELDNIKSDSIAFANFTVHSEPVKHTDHSLAYKIITSDNKKIVYSGDSDYCDGLKSISENADLLLCESSFPDDMKKEGHMTPSLAGKIAKRAKVQKLVLTHFYPECDSIDVKKQCAKIFKGEIVLAKDLMTIPI
jgi:ribonuclease BN (tRNA processing enzyme)